MNPKEYKEYSKTYEQGTSVLVGIEALGRIQTSLHTNLI